MPDIHNFISRRLDAEPPLDGIVGARKEGKVSIGTARRLHGQRLVSVWVVPVTKHDGVCQTIENWQQLSQRATLPAGPRVDDLNLEVRFDFTGVPATHAVVLALVAHRGKTYHKTVSLTMHGRLSELTTAAGAASPEAAAPAPAPAPAPAALVEPPVAPPRDVPSSDEIEAIQAAFDSPNTFGGIAKGLLAAPT